MVMDEKDGLQAPAADENEKVYVYLRRIRESQRITLEKIARETRLNLDYLYALEQGDYRVLPAEAYVRIYLRSLAKYLQLEPNAIVDRYQEEENQKNAPVAAKRPTGGLQTLATRSKAKPVSVVIILLVIFAVLSFLRTGKQEPEVQAPLTAAPVQDTVAAVPKADTAAKAPMTPEDSMKTAIQSDTAAPADSLLLVVLCDKDSSWIKVYRDQRNPWRQVLQHGHSFRFIAKKTFHLAFGRNETVSLYLNGKKLDMPRKRGVFRYVVDAKGVKTVSRNDWMALFSTNASRDSSASGRE